MTIVAVLLLACSATTCYSNRAAEYFNDTAL